MGKSGRHDSDGSHKKNGAQRRWYNKMNVMMKSTKKQEKKHEKDEKNHGKDEKTGGTGEKKRRTSAYNEIPERPQKKRKVDPWSDHHGHETGHQRLSDAHCNPNDGAVSKKNTSKSKKEQAQGDCKGKKGDSKSNKHEAGKGVRESEAAANKSTSGSKDNYEANLVAWLKEAEDAIEEYTFCWSEHVALYVSKSQKAFEKYSTTGHSSMKFIMKQYHSCRFSNGYVGNEEFADPPTKETLELIKFGNRECSMRTRRVMDSATATSSKDSAVSTCPKWIIDRAKSIQQKNEKFYAGWLSWYRISMKELYPSEGSSWQESWGTEEAAKAWYTVKKIQDETCPQQSWKTGVPDSRRESWQTDESGPESATRSTTSSTESEVSKSDSKSKVSRVEKEPALPSLQKTAASSSMQGPLVSSLQQEAQSVSRKDRQRFQQLEQTTVEKPTVFSREPVAKAVVLSIPARQETEPREKDTVTTKPTPVSFFPSQEDFAETVAEKLAKNQSVIGQSLFTGNEEGNLRSDGKPLKSLFTVNENGKAPFEKSILEVLSEKVANLEQEIVANLDVAVMRDELVGTKQELERMKSESRKRDLAQNTQIEAQAARAEKAEKELAANTQQRAANNARVTKAERELATTKQELVSTKFALGRAQNELGRVGSELGRAQQEVVGMGTELRQVWTEFSRVNAELVGVRNEFGQVKGQFGHVFNAFGIVNQAVAELKRGLGMLSNQVNQNSSPYDTAYRNGNQNSSSYLSSSSELSQKMDRILESISNNQTKSQATPSVESLKKTQGTSSAETLTKESLKDAENNFGDRHCDALIRASTGGDGSDSRPQETKVTSTGQENDSTIGSGGVSPGAKKCDAFDKASEFELPYLKRNPGLETIYSADKTHSPATSASTKGNITPPSGDKGSTMMSNTVVSSASVRQISPTHAHSNNSHMPADAVQHLGNGIGLVNVTNTTVSKAAGLRL